MHAPISRWLAVLCLPILLAVQEVHAASSRLIDASLPAESPVVGRMNLNDILDSPVGPAVMADLKDNYTAINWMMRATFGFELKAVDSFWFAQDS